MDSWITYILWAIHYSLYYFDTQPFPNLISGIPIQTGPRGLLTWLQYSSIVNHVLPFQHSGMFQAYLYTFPAPDLEPTIFLRGLGSF